LTVVGNSMGAALARMFAAGEPERVRRVVLVDGGRPLTVRRAPRLIARLPPVARLVGALAGLERAMGRYVAEPDRLTPAMKSQMRHGIRTYLHVQRRMLAQSALPPSELQPGCPVLVIWGAQDRLAGPHIGSQVAQEVGAQALAVIERAGHMPMFEQPEEFGRILRRFVES
jgi:pimeloyl-ACP methyl ester carboxylesterase